MNRDAFRRVLIQTMHFKETAELHEAQYKELHQRLTAWLDEGMKLDKDIAERIQAVERLVSAQNEHIISINDALAQSESGEAWKNAAADSDGEG